MKEAVAGVWGCVPLRPVDRSLLGRLCVSRTTAVSFVISRRCVRVCRTVKQEVMLRLLCWGKVRWVHCSPSVSPNSVCCRRCVRGGLSFPPRRFSAPHLILLLPPRLWLAPWRTSRHVTSRQIHKPDKWYCDFCSHLISRVCVCVCGRHALHACCTEACFSLLFRFLFRVGMVGWQEPHLGGKSSCLRPWRPDGESSHGPSSLALRLRLFLGRPRNGLQKNPLPMRARRTLAENVGLSV